jgi:hypothetical protein
MRLNITEEPDETDAPDGITINIEVPKEKVAEFYATLKRLKAGCIRAGLTNIDKEHPYALLGPILQASMEHYADEADKLFPIKPDETNPPTDPTGEA